MLRKSLAVLAGMVAASAIVFAIELGNSVLYPFPPGFDMNDQAQIAAFIQTMPAGAFVAVWLGWALGAFAGTLVTRKLTPGASLVPALTMAALFEAFCVLNMAMVPHPIAFIVASLVTTPLMAAAALYVAGDLRPKAA